MNHNFNGYDKVQNLKLNDLISYILYKYDINSVFADEWILKFFDNSSNLKILDFGCGVGRNSFGLSEKNKNLNIVAYDNDHMLKRATEYCYLKYGKLISDYPNITYTSDWEFVKSQKFDYIYATLVLQHIYEEELNDYCQTFKNITKNLIVHGRRFNDDKINDKYKNTWQILENNGLFPVSCSLQGNMDYKYSVYGEDLNDHFTCFYKF